MALKHLLGLDHVVMLARDLDAAAGRWRRLGFTLSPRGAHSAHLGTGNHTIMLEPDYIELLGILADTPYNAPSRAFLDSRGEGMERAAFTTDDAAMGVAEIRARSLDGVGPIDFGRPVALPGGGTAEARFRVFLWPTTEMPGGLRLFACQHLTPQAVWIPELMRHANTARRIVRVEILSPTPRVAADHLARLIDGAVESEPDGALRVPSGPGRAAFVFLDRAMLARRHPNMALDGLADEGAAALVVAAADLRAAAAAIGSAAVLVERSVAVPPHRAGGVILAFEQG
jgi:catechol 2,3-dioxygenase-like lactoylglutathione lyase family enzyme